MKIVVPLLFMVLWFSGSSRAADEVKLQQQNNIIMVSPIGVLFRNYGIEYERTLIRNVSLACDFLYWDVTSSGVDINGIELGISPRLFIIKQALNGLFLSLGIDVDMVWVKDHVTNETAKASGISIPIIFGYTWIWGETTGFALSLGAGWKFGPPINVLSVSGKNNIPILRAVIGFGF